MYAHVAGRTESYTLRRIHRRRAKVARLDTHLVVALLSIAMLEVGVEDATPL
jgi:hypothetical protein